MIEIAVEVGKPVLIENVLEDLDPPLDPILLKQIYKQGSRIIILNSSFVSSNNCEMCMKSNVCLIIVGAVDD